MAAVFASRTDVRTVCLLILATMASDGRDLSDVLKSVEQHYNRARTLEVRFEQRHTAQGRRRTENGTLVLRKPGRMRWDYASPEGKMFVSDGKWVWFYSPVTHRAERSRLKESEDFRAPLAFLLGKLDFSRDFKDFELRELAGMAVVRALPKTGNVPYTSVEFTVSASDEIRRLVVTGADASLMEFVFSGERMNPPVADARFRFTAPAGAEVVDVESIGDEERN